MTFKGSGIDDLQKILQAFPRDFTMDDVIGYFGWPKHRARQAIVNGQQTDLVRSIAEVKNSNGSSAYTVYENARWRQQWLKRAWGNNEPNVESNRQEHG